MSSREHTEESQSLNRLTAVLMLLGMVGSFVWLGWPTPERQARNAHQWENQVFFALIQDVNAIGKYYQPRYTDQPEVSIQTLPVYSFLREGLNLVDWRIKTTSDRYFLSIQQAPYRSCQLLADLNQQIKRQQTTLQSLEAERFTGEYTSKSRLKELRELYQTRLIRDMEQYQAQQGQLWQGPYAVHLGETKALTPDAKACEHPGGKVTLIWVFPKDASSKP